MNKQSVSPIVLGDKYRYLSKVKYTNDLTKFVQSQFNRDPKPRKNLKENLRKNGYDISLPIKIFEKSGTVVDGQNRLNAMREIIAEEGGDMANSRFCVSYVVDSNPNITEAEAVLLSNTTPPKSWTQDNFFIQNIRLGKKPYCILNNLIESSLEEASKSKQKAKVRRALNLPAAVHIFTIGLCSTATDEFKRGFMPLGDCEFFFFVKNYLINANALKNMGQRAYYTAITSWFAYIYPRLTQKQKDNFNRNFMNYATRLDTIKDYQEAFFKMAGAKNCSTRLLSLRNSLMENRKEEFKKTGFKEVPCVQTSYKENMKEIPNFK